MTPKEMAKKLAEALDGKMAQDIKILEISDLTVLADFFIVATGTSTTHLKTLNDTCEYTMEQLGERPHHIEGHMAGNWILMDYGAVVVHLFLQDTRAFYSMERLWADAKQWNVEDL